MKNIVIVGAGGFGRETALLIEQIGKWNIAGFYDDNLEPGTAIDGHLVKGKVNDLNDIKSDVAVALAVANPMVRNRLVKLLSNPRLNFPAIIHPTAMLGHTTNSIGRGCIITAQVIMTVGIKLSDFVIVNLASTIGHAAQIGEFASIMTQCNISGDVVLGNRCFVGSGATILPGIGVGDDSIVGAGAVVIRSFAANSKLVGVPAHNLTPTS